ncbi:hypothetical protein [Mycobacterium kansasii]|uniref:hypothetical protein n=1 Tax=Mycobacterium kansasii TaxID=1768 RepID=UPI000F03DF9E|nr:hypothetical protein [Mycobacterium kansasii]VAZ58357.1 hypothetical protein LAUMK22_00144 [Mycobacterium kansasii]
MGRHSLVRERRRSPAVLAAVLAPAAVFFAVAGDVGPLDARVVDQGDGPCCVEIVAATPLALVSRMPGSEAAMGLGGGQFAAASRWRVDTRSRALPPGAAPEQGLQVKTILVARSLSALFPEIHEIGGVRADALRWHPNGLALDVMIPDPGSADGIALGNQIVGYVLLNASRFGIQDAIWRGVYYTPEGARSTGAGHYDHVHITTTGGGYPTGEEIYLR